MTGLAAPSSHVGSDRVPGEIALLIVCSAALIAAAAVLIHRTRARRWRLGQQVAARANQRTGPERAEPDIVADRAESDSVPERPDGTDSLDSTGSPVSTGSPRWRPSARVLVAAVAAVVLAGAVGTVVFLAGGGHGAARRPSVAAGSVGPALGQAPGTGAPDAPSRAPGKHPGRGGGTAAGKPGSGSSGKSGSGSSGKSGSSSPSASPSPSRTATPTPKPSSSPTKTTPPPAPEIVLPSGDVQLDESGDDVYTGSFVLEAVNGSVSYVVSAPSQDDYFISFEQGVSGTVTPSQPVTVVVSITVFSGGSGTPPYVVVTPGGTVQFALPAS
jgi:hypothetical protein